MRVLVVHNRYSSRVPSGENLAVDDEVRWLREAGVDVHRHEVSNDDVVAPGPIARVRDGIAESCVAHPAAEPFSPPSTRCGPTSCTCTTSSRC